MTRWKTDEVLAVLTAALPNAKLEKLEPGGDVDTDMIMATLPNEERMWISGFITDGDTCAPDVDVSDMDVELVELTCGKDSRGGTHGVKDASLLMAYAQAQIALQAKGFDVVPCMKSYF